jgi:hypothetical protein
MSAEELVGVIDLDNPTSIFHPISGKLVAYYSLRYMHLNFVKMSDPCSLITKGHQSDISKPTHIIIPNTPEAEQLIGMINKNLPAFLLHMLKEQGLPEDFIDELIKKSCEALMLAGMHSCKWDAENWVLTPEDELARVEKTRLFEGDAWFKDKFGLLRRNKKNQRKYTAPEALFNLDDAGSFKTIHNHHQAPPINEQTNAPVRTPPRKELWKNDNRKNLVDLTNTERDFTSHLSLFSEGELISNDKGSHPKASDIDEDSLSTVDGR